jgi:succinate dehydrogenase/fumarate reductase flavoprotein subunit
MAARDGRPLPAAVDVLVAGSGAAGLVAALAAAEGGARVLVAERGEAFGGTTALSGGRVWVPGNTHAAVAGRPDSAVAAATYLRAACPTAPDGHVDAFVATAPAMAQWIERTTPHRFVLCPRYPDYHPSLPGATLGGRTLDSKPFKAGDLDGEVLRGPASAPVTHAEWERWRFVHRYDTELLAERDAAHVVTGGRALVAALLQACRAAGVALARGARVTELRTGEDGVTGAEIAHDGGPAEVACGAVVLATGGFDWSEDLRARHLRVPVHAYGSPPTNEGDAVGLAESAGAALEALEHGWMMPMVEVPGETLGGRPFFRSLVTERGIPRSILVNAAGARFVNESLPYNELVRAFQRPDAGGGFPNARAWLVFDEGFRRRYSLLDIRPDEPLPARVARGATLAELAERTGIDLQGLEASVVLWNAMCRHGRDEIFGRGESPYDRYYGDPELLPANPTLGPLDEPPFHAIDVLPGTIGTKGGPRTDPDGRVLREDGSPVAGLYAAGNAAAGWLADAYPGPGATLGVAMTFGWRAGRRAAGAGRGAGAGATGSPA